MSIVIARPLVFVAWPVDRHWLRFMCSDGKTDGSPGYLG